MYDAFYFHTQPFYIGDTGKFPTNEYIPYKSQRPGKNLKSNYNFKNCSLIFAVFSASIWNENYNEKCERWFITCAFIRILIAQDMFGGKRAIHSHRLFLYFPNRHNRNFFSLSSQTDSFQYHGRCTSQTGLWRCTNGSLRSTVEVRT